MAKIRLDQLLVNCNLAESKTRAQALILAQKVMDENHQLLTKAGMQVRDDMVVVLKEKDHPWVSRGGMKLAKALQEYAIDVTGQVLVDIGASTGGFTDVLLTLGAIKVYAIDVGYGQLHEKLRQDARVINIEKTNARYVTAEVFEDTLDGLVCDASFISLKTVLPATMAFIKPKGWMAVLIKPQFEAGKENLAKGGVVRDPALHQAICDDIAEWVSGNGWHVQGITQSPITGPKGNVEFLLVAHKL